MAAATRAASTGSYLAFTVKLIQMIGPLDNQNRYFCVTKRHLSWISMNRIIPSEQNGHTFMFLHIASVQHVCIFDALSWTICSAGLSFTGCEMGFEFVLESDPWLARRMEWRSASMMTSLEPYDPDIDERLLAGSMMRVVVL
jgi:hypothetical protein